METQAEAMAMAWREGGGEKLSIDGPADIEDDPRARAIKVRGTHRALAASPWDRCRCLEDCSFRAAVSGGHFRFVTLSATCSLKTQAIA